MSTDSQKRRTIQVSQKTHAKLTKICLKDETYDELINRLMFDETKKPSNKKSKYEDKL